MYILLRGQRTMTGLGPMSASIRQAAASQDMIGWREFMEGKVSTKIADIQRTHVAAAPCMMNGDDWMRHLISHILHMTQSQWISGTSPLSDYENGRRFCGRWRPCWKRIHWRYQQKVNSCWNLTLTRCTDPPSSGRPIGCEPSRQRGEQDVEQLCCGRAEEQALVVGRTEGKKYGQQ